MRFLTPPVLRAACLALALAGLAAPAPAHEFWISPEKGRYAPGETITGDLMVGIALRGEPSPYLTNRFLSFTVTVDGRTEPIPGQEGDLPALRLPAGEPGLHILAQHSIAFLLTHDDWGLFQRYLRDEGMPWIAALHRERGLPEQGFDESYIRCAKTLVQVGPPDATDIDRKLDLPLEIVVGANPYVSGTERLPVRLTWQGAPLAGRQITVYRDTGTGGPDAVIRSTYVTDADGRAEVALSGPGEYLLNAVDLRPVARGQVVWQSHWATLGFRL